MSHQGLKILYEIVNARPEYLAERLFAPWLDREEQLRRDGQPLAALESGRPLAHFDVLGFPLPYELTYTNILTMLDLAGLPLLARDRDERHPLVAGGGPGAFNPEPLADFFDFFLLGDGEEAVREIMDAVRESRAAGENREAQLARLGRIERVYGPRWYRAEHDAAGRVAALVPLRDVTPGRIRKRILADLDAAPFPVRPPVPFDEDPQAGDVDVAVEDDRASGLDPHRLSVGGQRSVPGGRIRPALRALGEHLDGCRGAACGLELEETHGAEGC